jgi:K+-transporting ATPase c subunit
MAAAGSELDPHPTLAGALVQAPRIGAAREPLVKRTQAALQRRAKAMPRGDVELVSMVDANLAWDAREAGELDHGRR